MVRQRHAAFDTWSARHDGRPLAILVDYRTEMVFPMRKDAARLKYTSVGMAREKPSDDPSTAEMFLQRVVSKGTRSLRSWLMPRKTRTSACMSARDWTRGTGPRCWKPPANPRLWGSFC